MHKVRFVVYEDPVREAQSGNRKPDLANISTVEVGRMLSVKAATPWIPQSVCPNLSPCVVDSMKGVVTWDAVVSEQS